MIERVLENWLAKANERSYQVPFCHALAAQGYRVVHLSRHTGIEMGKDILAVAPDGVPCAYQLKGTKGRKLGMNEYRTDVQPQLHDLVFARLVHPSINSTLPHRAYLVVNGELEEEVIREIDDFNLMRVQEGNPSRQVRTILRGDLFRFFQELETNFWPINVADLNTLLELFLNDGKGRLPKEKIATLLAATFPLDIEQGKPPSNTEASRAFAAGAVLCALGLNSFTAAENHAAEFEAWTIYFCRGSSENVQISIP